MEPRPSFPVSAVRWNPAAKTATTVLAPYNVNTQNVRTRFWDGKDNFFSDDLTNLKGQSPDPVRRPVPAQLQLPPAHR